MLTVYLTILAREVVKTVVLMHVEKIQLRLKLATKWVSIAG